MVQRSHQLGELGATLDLHEPQGALADLHDAALGRPPRLLDQRGNLGRLDAAVDHLQSGLTRDLAPDRVHRAERGLVLLGVDTELGARLLCDDRQR